MNERIKEIKTLKFNISETSIFMTTQNQKGLKGITEQQKFIDDINKDIDTINLKDLIKLFKDNYKEFEKVKITKYNNNLYFEFEDDEKEIRYIIKCIENNFKGIEQNEFCRYDTKIIYDFLNNIPKKEINKQSEINISFKTEHLLFMDYGNENILIVAPIIED